MELLDRYLQSVKKYLPWERQDDIIAELKANLESQLEDKEAELDRPLTKEEQEAWLKQIGPPMQVAARYLPQRYLIGPAVFPMYWYVLKLACFWCVVIYTIVSAVQIYAGGIANGTDVAVAMLRIPGILITAAAWVTLIFAVIEFGVRLNPPKYGPLAGAPFDWSPDALPPVGKDVTHGKKPRSFSQALVELVFGFIFLVWLLLVPKNPWLLMGPGAVYLHASPCQLAPIWLSFYWCVVAINVVQLGWMALALWKGKWQDSRNVRRRVMQVLGLIPLLLLFTVPDHAFVGLKHPALDQARYGGTLHAINHGIYSVWLLILFIAGMQLAWDLGRMGLNAYRRRLTATR